MSVPLLKRGRGRPKTDDPRDIVFTCNLTFDEGEAIVNAATRAKKQRATWIRNTLLAAALKPHESC